MLNDLRNCFLGRINGLDGLLVWFPIGDPFRNELLFILPKGLLGRGGPIIDTGGLFADCGLRS